MKFYVRKSTREVAMHSTESISVDTEVFEEFDHMPSSEEQEKITNNQPMKLIDNTLVFEQV